MPRDPAPANISLRKATATDASDVAAIVQYAYQGYIDRLGRPPEPMLIDYDRAIGEGDFFVVEIDGIVVGILGVSDHNAGFVLENVAVDPTCQSQGIGRLLIAYAEHEAARRGHDCITLYTNEAMVENRKLYRRLGYEEVAAWRERGYDRIFMEKRLIPDRDRGC